MAELCNLEKFAAKVSELLPLVSKTASYDHYTHHTNMKETLCTRVSAHDIHLLKRNLGLSYAKLTILLVKETLKFQTFCIAKTLPFFAEKM